MQSVLKAQIMMKDYPRDVESPLGLTNLLVKDTSLKVIRGEDSTPVESGEPAIWINLCQKKATLTNDSLKVRPKGSYQIKYLLDKVCP